VTEECCKPSGEQFYTCQICGARYEFARWPPYSGLAKQWIKLGMTRHCDPACPPGACRYWEMEPPCYRRREGQGDGGMPVSR
jgi:hypothetical protein